MTNHTITFAANGRITWIYWNGLRNWHKRYLADLTELPERLRYKVAILNSCRKEDGKGFKHGMGTTRMRRDGGTHYEIKE
jgi:hypothetical protein